MNRDGDFLRVGEKKTGEILFNFENKYIRAGEKPDGNIVFNKEENYTRVGGATIMPYNSSQSLLSYFIYMQ